MMAIMLLTQYKSADLIDLSVVIKRTYSMVFIPNDIVSLHQLHRTHSRNFHRPRIRTETRLVKLCDQKSRWHLPLILFKIKLESQHLQINFLKSTHFDSKEQSMFNACCYSLNLTVFIDKLLWIRLYSTKFCKRMSYHYQLPGRVKKLPNVHTLGRYKTDCSGTPRSIKTNSRPKQVSNVVLRIW